MMLHSDRREVWSARIEDYRSSGLSMREWCEKNGITRNQLRYWLRRLLPGVQRVGWAPVEIIEDKGSPGKADGCRAQITVCLGAARIEVQPGSDPALLSDVLKVVASLC